MTEAIEKPVMSFDRRYERQDGKKKHVIELSYKDESYRSEKKVPHDVEELTYEEIMGHFNRSINTFQRLLTRRLSD